MKKVTIFCLSLICIVYLAACSRSMDDIIKNEPHITGVVTEVFEHSFEMHCESIEGYPSQQDCSISLDVENKDSYTSVTEGDEVVVYYNGEIQEIYPLQISKVYAITLLTPAERNEVTANSSPEKEPLTMEKVKELAKKGEDLSWSDFEPYMGEDVGSGLYMIHYGIDENYYILVGGGYMDEPPMYIRLVSAKNRDIFIDIRTESIDDFIRNTSVLDEDSYDAQSEKGDSYSRKTGFSEFANLQFRFSSGAGAWQTCMRIDSSGDFTGEYSDVDMGDREENYPNGTTYQCRFSGKFTEPVKVNDFTYSMQIQEITYEKEPETEEIIDGIRFCYEAPYGLDGAEEILIYKPGAPLDKLPEEYRNWVGYSDLSMVKETKLPFWGLYNMVKQCGFSSSNLIIEQTKEMLTAQEEAAALLEESLEKDALTQADYNVKTYEMYEIWDDTLNNIWSALKQVLEEDVMNSLILEQREWITMKEQAITETGEEVAGGSMAPMVRNLRAVELTKSRVYELMEILEGKPETINSVGETDENIKGKIHDITWYKAGDISSTLSFFVYAPEESQPDGALCMFDVPTGQVGSDAGGTWNITRQYTGEIELLPDNWKYELMLSASSEQTDLGAYELFFDFQNENSCIIVTGDGELAGEYYSADAYKIPDLFLRYLTAPELCTYSQEDLRLLRNEIYAAHGRKFESEELRDYFSKMPWYRGRIDSEVFTEEVLSDWEKENAALIRKLEEIPEDRRNMLDGQPYYPETLPEAPYLSLIEDRRGETGLHVDLTTAKDMGVYTVVQGEISVPLTVTREQLEMIRRGEQVEIVINELSGETWGDFQRKDSGDNIHFSYDYCNDVYEIKHLSDDTIMKTVYEGDIFLLKGAVTGAYVSESLASHMQKQIFAGDGKTEVSDLYANCLKHNGKGYFTAIYYLGD